jgi:hypothetical protein
MVLEENGEPATPQIAAQRPQKCSWNMSADYGTGDAVIRMSQHQTKALSPNLASRAGFGMTKLLGGGVPRWGVQREVGSAASPVSSSGSGATLYKALAPPPPPVAPTALAGSCPIVMQQ